MNNRPSFLSNVPPVVLNLIIINILCWIAATVLPNALHFDVNSFFGLHYWGSSKFNPLQLFSYMFMHDNHGFSHLFFNMFGLYMFGCMLENIWGGRKFLFFYIVCGVGAGIIQELTWMIDLHGITAAMNEAIASNSGEALIPYQHLFTGNIANASATDVIRLKQQLLSGPLTVGASGSLFGILLAFGWLFPQAKMMMLFIPIPIPARIFVAIYAVVELFLGVTNFSFDNVAHFAHLGGMIFAALLLFVWKKQGKLYR